VGNDQHRNDATDVTIICKLDAMDIHASAPRRCGPNPFRSRTAKPTAGEGPLYGPVAVPRRSAHGQTTHAAPRSKSSFYAVSIEDRTINPDLERFMAKRMGIKNIEVKASHLSLISHPDEIADLILEAAG
jgi:hypothetical protein